MRTISLTEMTWPEFARGLPHTLIALCVGSLEQHGPHLPLSVDSLIPYHLCLELGKKIPLFVAPPLYYGYRSSPFTGGGQSFPVPLPSQGRLSSYCCRTFCRISYARVATVF